MIKRFVILRRRADMPKAEFWRYWEEIHGPLIAKLPGLRRYVQYHVRSERLDDAEPEIDGVAELWFDSEADQKASYASPEYAAVVADEPNLFAMDSVHVHPVIVERMVEIVAAGETTADQQEAIDRMLARSKANAGRRSGPLPTREEIYAERLDRWL